MPIKVAFIGAGSVGFCRGLFHDILCVPELRDTHFAFHDVSKQNLDYIYQLCKRDIAKNRLPATITPTTDRRRAVDGADYVINCVRIGGLDAFRSDVEIPLKYGVDQAIGDTICAGGIMYGQRNIPQILAFCKDIRELAKKDVLFLNYANPNAMNTWAAIEHGKVSTVGLCHGVMGGHSTITGVIEFLINKGKKPTDRGYRTLSTKEVDIICAGINHQTWFIQVRFEGEDWTGRMLEGFQAQPSTNFSEKTRIDVLKNFGYFSTESNPHLSEYLAWYRKRPGELGNWVLQGGEVGDTGSYLLSCIGGRQSFEENFHQLMKAPPLSFEPKTRGIEHGSYIIEGLETGRVYRGHFNVRNSGCITNLPEDAVVEVPGYVDRNGMGIPRVGDLPTGCAAVCNASISVQRLSVQAAVTGDVAVLKQAMLMDPLVGAVCTPPEISQMTDEMLVAQAAYLPQYKSAIPAAKVRLKSEPPLGTHQNTFGGFVDFMLHQESVKDWHVVGPFPSPKAGTISLEMPTPVEDAFATLGEGCVDLKARFRTRGKTLAWKPVHADNGVIDLDTTVGRREWAVAYGYAEIHSPSERQATIGLSSDDGVKAWLNGQMVHSHDVQRPCQAGVVDRVQVTLRKGKNRLLVKIDNYILGWSFKVAVS